MKPIPIYHEEPCLLCEVSRKSRLWSAIADAFGMALVFVVLFALLVVIYSLLTSPA